MKRVLHVASYVRILVSRGVSSGVSFAPICGSPENCFTASTSVDHYHHASWSASPSSERGGSCLLVSSSGLQSHSDPCPPARPIWVQVFLLDGESITRLALQILVPRWKSAPRAWTVQLILNAGSFALLTSLLSLVTRAVVGQ